jgi:hypothetical protein
VNRFQDRAKRPVSPVLPQEIQALLRRGDGELSPLLDSSNGIAPSIVRAAKSPPTSAEGIERYVGSGRW